MANITRALDSTVGQKFVAGATGIALVGFLVVHMIGNLQIFAGAKALNDYADLLKSKSSILWGARIGLFALITLHIAMTVRQRLRNRRLRPQRYAQNAYQRTSKSSRSMMVTGTILLIFIVFHLLHFTVGVILPGAHAQADDQGRHDVYAMVIESFGHPMIVAIYVIAMIALSTHLHHAISSAWQTLGIASQGHDLKLRVISPLLSAAIVLGFLVIPISVVLGFVGG